MTTLTIGLTRAPGRNRLPPCGPAALRRSALGWRIAIGLGLGLALGGPLAAAGQTAPASSPTAAAAASTTPPAVPVAPLNSALDAPLFYQLLIGEFARQEGNTNDAVELILEAARRTRDDALFRRAVEIAAEAGSGEKAVTITRTWRQTLPKSVEAVRTQLQFLFALDRVTETAEPLRTLLAMTSGSERASLIASLPRAAQRAKDKAGVAAQFQQLLTPYLDLPETRTAARVALGRMRLAEGKPAAALELARGAQAHDPSALGPALLALDLMNQAGAKVDAEAETLVKRYLAEPNAEPVLRQAYASLLATQQRIAEAAQQLRLVTAARPQQPALWLSLGELELDLRHPEQAEQALLMALELAHQPPADAAASDDGDPAGGNVRVSRIYLLLARAAELRNDDAGVAQWLARIDPKEIDPPAIAMRAGLLTRQGRLEEARALVRSAPADTPAALRTRTLMEVQLLREQKQLAEARNVLASANAQSPGDIDLIYEQAMIDERLDKLDEMELLLRQVIKLQPDHAQALNALGYSLADRSLRLDEARQLVMHAHELAPADPFIADSLGWVEFRRSNLGEAVRWLRQAYAARNDTEIAAHLGEALWTQGHQEEALQIWRDAQGRDAGNEVLRETLTRLRAAP